MCACADMRVFVAIVRNMVNEVSANHTQSVEVRKMQKKIKLSITHSLRC